MNIEQDHLDSRLRQQISSIGLQEFRRQALKGLKLKTVIKVLHRTLNMQHHAPTRSKGSNSRFNKKPEQQTSTCP
jgi:hypothetical protein